MNDSKNHDGPTGGEDPTANVDPSEDPTLAYSSSDAASGARSMPTLTETLPESIGPFRILGKLGAGGMGVVYEAEQDQPRRRVALKVVRAGSFADDQQLRMFRREADTLARLKHPGIAGIHQVGETADGQPYLVMELIHGRPLDEFLALQPTLRTRGEMELRLRLFRQICDAVHYAHQRGIIHRDLKPSNVLVTEPSADESSGSSAANLPRAKILDFGLARIVDSEATQMTEVGMIKGTLQYMSPEQTHGRPGEVDTRADVYALGALLYEVLSGARPYELKKEALTEAVRIIREKTPAPLSSVWKTPFRPDPDIETIVGKALEKEPDRRYSSVAALSEDIERYLGSQPILARPPSAAYQLRKMVVRHRAIFVTAAAALGLVLAASVVSTLMYVRSERAAERAHIEAAKSDAVAMFMTDMLKSVGPAVARGRDTTMLREILDDTVERIADELQASPEVALTLQSHIAQTYFDLSELEPAEKLYRETLEQSRSIHGPEHPETLRLMSNLATLLSVTDRLDEAEGLFERALELRRDVLAPGDPAIGETLMGFGNLLNTRSRHDEAEATLLQAIDILRAAGEDGNQTLGIALNSLANLHHAEGRLDDAEPLYREALALHTAGLGEDHPNTIVDRHNIAYLLRNRGDLAAADEMFREILATQRRILGEEHRDVATTLSSLGSVRQAMGDFVGAEAHYREALELTGRVEGEDSGSYAHRLNALANPIRLLGDEPTAERLFRRALAIQRRVYGDDSDEVATTRGNLAALLIATERLDEAGEELNESLRIVRSLHGDDHPSVLLALNELGRLQRKMNRLDLAEQTLREVLAARLRNGGRADGYVGRSQYELGLLLLDIGDEESVAEGERLLRDAAETYIAANGEDYPAVPIVRFRLGRQLRSRGAFAEAEELMLAAHAGYVKAYGAEHANPIKAAAEIAEFYETWGKPGEAAKWRR